MGFLNKMIKDNHYMVYKIKIILYNILVKLRLGQQTQRRQQKNICKLAKFDVI